MRRSTLFAGVLAFACAGMLARTALTEDPPMPPEEMMKRWKEANTPTAEHQDLTYMLGTWDVGIQLLMPGAPPSPPEPAVATGAWLFEGRFMSLRMKGTMMGMPYEGFGIFGYDKTKKNHVSAWVDSSNLALHHAAGPKVDPTGKVQTYYGTLDEFLTGEHDKPVRYTIRRESPDKFTFEVWDLTIGPEGAVVIRYTFTRKK